MNDRVFLFYMYQNPEKAGGILACEREDATMIPGCKNKTRCRENLSLTTSKHS